jgi:uncharacterized protein YuzE
MKINYDKIADALYLNINKGKIHKTIRMNDRLLVDVNKKGNVLGIEMLDVSSSQKIKDLQKYIKTGIPVNFTSTSLVGVN